MGRPRSICVVGAAAALAAGFGSAAGMTSGGAGSKRDQATVVVAPGKHRFDRTELRPGDTVRCRGGVAGAMVPEPGEGVTEFADGTTRTSTITVANHGGAIVVECEVS